jgi:hypothetical protein
MGVDKARNEGGFADALGTENDDFRFEGVWRLWRGHVFDVQSWVLSWSVSCRSQKLRVSYLLFAFSAGFSYRVPAMSCLPPDSRGAAGMSQRDPNMPCN